jgi:hypothetical protein
MEWLKKLLEAAEVKDGKLDIESLMTKINTEFPKNAIPKSQYNDLAETKKTLEADLKARDEQLATLKKGAGDNKELQEQIDKLEKANKEAADNYEAKLKDMSITAAVEKALVSSNAKFPDLLIGKIDKAKIEVLQDGTVKGLEDQLKPLKESYKDLFGEEKLSGGNPSGGGNPDPDPDPNNISDDEFFQQALKDQK